MYAHAASEKVANDKQMLYAASNHPGFSVSASRKIIVLRLGGGALGGAT